MPKPMPLAPPAMKAVRPVNSLHGPSFPDQPYGARQGIQTSHFSRLGKEAHLA